jgi:hypothetical protein
MNNIDKAIELGFNDEQYRFVFEIKHFKLVVSKASKEFSIYTNGLGKIHPMIKDYENTPEFMQKVYDLLLTIP